MAQCLISRMVDHLSRERARIAGTIAHLDDLLVALSATPGG